MDFQNPSAPSVVTVEVRDCTEKGWFFWLVQADSVEELVKDSEHRDYLQMPSEVLGIVDQCSPSRVVQTVNRYLRDIAKVGLR